MRIRRRRLRSALVLVGCLVGDVPFVGDGPGGAAGAESTRLAIALVLLAAGSALHLWSKGCLEQNRRLVTAGPYRFTRNPFYLANGLVDLGLCALIGRWWVAGPYLVLWWLAYRETIGREEATLRLLFPVEFERYVERVPRLLPDGRALARAEAVGCFGFDNPALAQGSEYARLLGFGVAAAAVVASAWLREMGLAAFAEEHAVGLAVVLLVPVAWVVKLAVAERHRRPETLLLPLSARPELRRMLTIGCAFGIAGLVGYGRGIVWLCDPLLLWILLAVLDRRGPARRRDAESATIRGQGRSHAIAPVPWRMRRAIALGALATALVVAGLRYLL